MSSYNTEYCLLRVKGTSWYYIGQATPEKYYHVFQRRYGMNGSWEFYITTFNPVEVVVRAHGNTIEDLVGKCFEEFL